MASEKIAIILFRSQSSAKYVIVPRYFLHLLTRNCVSQHHWNGDAAISHDDVIKWKHFQRNWPFVRGIHRSPVDSPHKGQWRRALVFSLICASTNGWTNDWGTDDLRRHRAYYDVTVMCHWLQQEMSKCRGHWPYYTRERSGRIWKNSPLPFMRLHKLFKDRLLLAAPPHRGDRYVKIVIREELVAGGRGISGGVHQRFVH